MADTAVRFCIDTKAVITTAITANAARFDQAVKLFIAQPKEAVDFLVFVTRTFVAQVKWIYMLKNRLAHVK